MSEKEIPVLLITGYLGSGKTTLLNHILSNADGVRYAVIVNDIGEVNIDETLIRREGVVGGADDGDLVALQNGCICCSLRMDLVEQLAELIATGQFDAIVIEASGICEPAPIAQTICAIPQMEEQYRRGGTPRLCGIVTVVDALRMRDEFGCGKVLVEHDASDPDADLQALVVEQIEFCNVVLLNKISEISAEERVELLGVIKALQPKARIVECDYCDVRMSQLMPPGGEFSFDGVATSAGWISHIEAAPTEEEEHHAHHPAGCTCGCHDHDHDHDHDDHHHDHDHHDHEHGHTHHGGGIDTFVYYRRAPFDIHAFDRFIATQWPKGVIRTKGVIYFAHHRDMSYLFEQAGKQKKLTEAGYWFATAPADELQQLMLTEPGLRRDWDPEYGDRMIKLVFIGRGFDPHKLADELDKCLG